MQILEAPASLKLPSLKPLRANVTVRNDTDDAVLCMLALTDLGERVDISFEPALAFVEGHRTARFRACLARGRGGAADPGREVVEASWLLYGGDRLRDRRPCTVTVAQMGHPAPKTKPGALVPPQAPGGPSRRRRATWAVVAAQAAAITVGVAVELALTGRLPIPLPFVRAQTGASQSIADRTPPAVGAGSSVTLAPLRVAPRPARAPSASASRASHAPTRHPAQPLRAAGRAAAGRRPAHVLKRAGQTSVAVVSAHAAPVALVAPLPRMEWRDIVHRLAWEAHERKDLLAVGP